MESVGTNNEAARATNQAIGRCIRHKDDAGTALLLDSRYAQPDEQALRPVWLNKIKAFSKFEEVLDEVTSFCEKTEMFYEKAREGRSQKVKKVKEVKQKDEMREEFKRDRKWVPRPGRSLGMERMFEIGESLM